MFVIVLFHGISGILVSYGSTYAVSQLSAFL